VGGLTTSPRNLYKQTFHMKEPRMPATCVLEITNDQSFQQEVLDDSGTVLIDFYSDSCPPCNAMAPVLEQVCSEMSGRIKVVKANAFDCRQTAKAHGVQSVPTFVLYRAGKAIAQTRGLQAKKVFTNWIQSALAKS
jgi:thioredoxin 1